jgi:hypothetical protein
MISAMRAAAVIALGLAVLAGTAQARAAVSHCARVRGYTDVRVSGVTCAAAGSVLWYVRQHEGVRRYRGFTCPKDTHGKRGGFPIETVCTRGAAYARGWIIDGPA